MRYSKIIITNIPSFYKINLYNRINRKLKVFVIFTGDVTDLRNDDFFSGSIEFDYISMEKKKLVERLITTWKIVKKTSYDEIIICGVTELTSWLCAFISPVYKNATVVESSYHEATITGIRGFLKSIFFKRISITYASGKAQEKLARLHHFKGKVIITRGVGIFNIVDQPTYIPSQNVTNFLYVGRLSSEKNLKFLIYVFNELVQYKLHIVGYGPQEQELKKIANDNIIFYGAIANKELTTIYKSCDVFVLCSIREAWGLVVEEALNNGLPVLLSNNIGCTEEIIEENINGLIFEFNNKKSLLEKIDKIVEIDFYNTLKKNISKMDFNAVADYQVNCYL